MPWEGKTVEELRKEFVLASKENSKSFSSLCREYGITRKTGYKWINRFNSNESLTDKSRCPNTISNKTKEETEQAILTVRRGNPAWGGKKIRDVLEKSGYENLPCVRTCSSILKRNGCIEPEESLKHKPSQRFEREHCNELWQTDFKGDFSLLDNTRCYPLTIIDDHSRFSIMIDAKPDTKGVRNSFRQAFLEYGMPWSVLSDNGSQFSGFRGGYTLFERWLMDHNILPIHGRIMHPQTQGKIERFHRTMKQELLTHRSFTNLEDANKGLQEWRLKYNEVRPHEALGMRCPAEIYLKSDRQYSDSVDFHEYDNLYHVIKVNSWGYLRFDKYQMYLSETMADTRLEIRPNPLGDSFMVCYRNFQIADINAATGKLNNRKISRL